MSDIFVSVPTKHGEAKLLWNKAQSAAIIPTGKNGCTLHYDGIPIAVTLSSQDLADKLSVNPLVSIQNLQSKWLGQAHEGYSHLTMHYSFKGRLGDGDHRDYWLHQLMQVHVFQTPVVAPGFDTLQTKLRLVVLMHAYSNDPYDDWGREYENRAQHVLSLNALASFDAEVILSEEEVISHQILHSFIARTMAEKVFTKREAKENRYHDVADQIRMWFATGSESIIQCPEFPGAESFVTDAEYTARLNKIDEKMRSSFEYQLADLHAQSRKTAGEAIAWSIRYAGNVTAHAVQVGASMQAMATVAAGAHVASGQKTAAMIRENIRQPRL
jgi:hypothetical protein